MCFTPPSLFLIKFPFLLRRLLVERQVPPRGHRKPSAALCFLQMCGPALGWREGHCAVVLWERSCHGKDGQGRQEGPCSSQGLWCLTLRFKPLVHKGTGLKPSSLLRKNSEHKEQRCRNHHWERASSITKAEHSMPGNQRFRLVHSRHGQRCVRERSVHGQGVL